MRFYTIMKYLYQNGGIRNFYSGMSVVASGCMPAHACYFSVYEFARNKLGINNEKLYPHLFMLTGIAATFLHDLILTPFDGN